MLKISCDSCQKDISELANEFMFEATIHEVKTIHDLISPEITPQKRMTKKVIHLCKECFEKHLSKNI